MIKMDLNWNYNYTSRLKYLKANTEIKICKACKNKFLAMKKKGLIKNSNNIIRSSSVCCSSKCSRNLNKIQRKEL